jgi:hypothetical protein
MAHKKSKKRKNSSEAHHGAAVRQIAKQIDTLVKGHTPTSRKVQYANLLLGKLIGHMDGWKGDPALYHVMDRAARAVETFVSAGKALKRRKNTGRWRRGAGYDGWSKRPGAMYTTGSGHAFALMHSGGRGIGQTVWNRGGRMSLRQNGRKSNPSPAQHAAQAKRIIREIRAAAKLSPTQKNVHAVTQLLGEMNAETRGWDVPAALKKACAAAAKVARAFMAREVGKARKKRNPKRRK